MNKAHSPHAIQAAIPSVHAVLALPDVADLVTEHGSALIKDAVRQAQADLREILAIHGETALGETGEAAFIARLKEQIKDLTAPSLKQVFNLTGTVLHTNLGRARLPDEAIRTIAAIAGGASNLEYDLETGKRGDRDSHLEAQICHLTGAEAATFVNNNAAAVLLVLNSLARRKEVLVSRGELIEIGGSFRLPELMTSAGCKLKEVGTTNRTHLHDFEEALGSRTALILKAHTSNYEIQGFTASAPEPELASLAQSAGLPFIVDLGSGTLTDLSQFGLPRETSPAETLASGADLVTFSGDKLLGGPQCGIIAGRRDLVAKIRKNPMKRALRCDKMTIAALSVVLKLHLDPERAAREIPTLRLLARPECEIRDLANRLRPLVQARLDDNTHVETISCQSQIGSGALPLDLMPSAGLAITPKTTKKRSGVALARLAGAFRRLPVPVIGRLHDGSFILDFRCLEDEAAFAKQIAYLDMTDTTRP